MFAHVYPGEVGSAATNPCGGVTGAMALHATKSLTYVAPAARAIGNAVARCGPQKSGSKIEVRNGIVLGVEMTCWRVFADLAAAEVEAGTTARAQSAEIALQRSTTRADARRDTTFQGETLNRTAGDGSRALGRLSSARAA
jgi:hypothetical protein